MQKKGVVGEVTISGIERKLLSGDLTLVIQSLQGREDEGREHIHHTCASSNTNFFNLGYFKEDT